MWETEPVPAPEIAPPRKPGSARYLFCLVLLILEAFVALFMALVLFGLHLVPAGLAWGIGAAIAALALLAAGLLRSPAGYVLGWLTQALMIASGVYILDMIILGLIFGALWVVSVVLGGRVDRERAERYRAELRWFEEQTGGR